MVSAMENAVNAKSHLPVLQYFKNIYLLLVSILEGMAVTMSYLFRRPITIQYPYKMEESIDTVLPLQFRGILEVDLPYCIACLRCANTCPIDCIAIDLEKNAETKERFITRFDIDISKCMFCGLCVEGCSTGAIHHTKIFNGTSHYIENLVLEFVDTPVRPFKKPKSMEDIPLDKSGKIAKNKLKDFFSPPEFVIDHRKGKKYTRRER